MLKSAFHTRHVIKKLNKIAWHQHLGCTLSPVHLLFYSLQKKKKKTRQGWDWRCCPSVCSLWYREGNIISPRPLDSCQLLRLSCGSSYLKQLPLKKNVSSHRFLMWLTLQSIYSAEPRCLTEMKRWSELMLVNCLNRRETGSINITG